MTDVRTDIAAYYDEIGASCYVGRKGSKGPTDTDWQNKGMSYSKAWSLVQDPSNNYDKVAHILDPSWFVIDVDTVEGGHEDGFASLNALENELGYLLDDVCEMIVESPSGGTHYIFRKSKAFKLPAKALKRFPGIDLLSPKKNKDGSVKAGCVIAAGSKHGRLDGEYKLLKSGTPSMVPDEILEFISDEAERDEQEKKKDRQVAPSVVTSGPTYKVSGQRSGDAFNKSPEGLSVMIGELEKEGYDVWQVNGGHQWRHPAASSGHNCSGTIGNMSQEGNYMFYAFTTSTVFTADETMTIFAAFAQLRHGGDLKAAAIALYDMGFGDAEQEEDLSGYDFSFIDSMGTGVTLSKSATDQVVPSTITTGDSPVAKIKSSHINSTKVEPLPSDLLYDDYLLGDLVRWVESRQQFAMPELALAASLHILGLSAARKWRGGKYDKHGTCANLYLLSVAPTGSGKEVPRTCVKEFVMEAGHPDMTGLEKLSSGPGLEWAVSQEPICPLIPDELGDLIKVMCNNKSQGYMQQISPALKTLFTSSTSPIWKGSSRVQDDAPSVSFPYVSLMGSTTPGMFFKSLSTEKIEDGLLGRFTMLHGELTADMIEEAFSGEQSGDRSPVPRKALRGWKFLRGDITMHGGPEVPSISTMAVPEATADNDNEDADAEEVIEWKTIPRSKEAFDRFNEHYKQIALKNLEHERKGESTELCIWSRVTEKTAKFAMLFGLSRYAYNNMGDPEITLDDMNRAIKLSNTLARRLISSIKTLVHDSQVDEDEMAFLKVLEKQQQKSGGGGVASSKLYRVAPLKALKASNKDKPFIELLRMTDLIHVEDVPGKGAKFHLTEDGLAKLQGQES